MNEKEMEEAEKYKCGCKVEGGRVICPTHFEPLEGLEPEVEEAKDIAHENALDSAIVAYIKAVRVLEAVKRKKIPIDQEYIEAKKRHGAISAQLLLADVEAQSAMSAIAITLQLQGGLIDSEKAAEKLAGIMEHVKKRIQQIAPQLQKEEGK